MKTCPQCNETNDDDQRFCQSCGMDMGHLKSSADADAAAELPSNFKQNIKKLKAKPESKNTAQKELAGRLILPDKKIVQIDDSQKFIGRADLRQYTKVSPEKIPRSYFTVCLDDGRHILRNDTILTKNKTILVVNNEMRNEEKIELKNGDRITVSDVEIVFEI